MRDRQGRAGKIGRWGGGEEGRGEETKEMSVHTYAYAYERVVNAYRGGCISKPIKRPYISSNWQNLEEARTVVDSMKRRFRRKVRRETERR